MVFSRLVPLQICLASICIRCRFSSASDFAVTHYVSRLAGRRLGAVLPVDPHKVGERGRAGQQRGRLAAEEGQQHLFEQQRGRDALHAADGGVRQLQRRGRGRGG